MIHENRGLIEPNKDIARRYAKRGYVALAPDLVSRAGGTDQFLDDLTQATGALGRSSPDDLVDDLLASVSYISALVSVDSALLGATGFCMGGGLVWRLIEAATNIKSAVPFYGPTPPLDNVPNINAAVLGIYAELDTRITGSSDALYTALNAAGIANDKWIAPGANHGFFNNTGGVYHPTDALEAWQRALAWFAKTLIA